MGLIIISFVQTSKLAYKYRLRLWIYVRDSPDLSGELKNQQSHAPTATTIIG